MTENIKKKKVLFGGNPLPGTSWMALFSIYGKNMLFLTLFQRAVTLRCF